MVIPLDREELLDATGPLWIVNLDTGRSGYGWLSKGGLFHRSTKQLNIIRAEVYGHTPRPDGTKNLVERVHIKQYGRRWVCYRTGG